MKTYEMEVYISLESEFAGEVKGFLFQGTLDEAKDLVFSYDKQAEHYTMRAEDNDQEDNHYVDLCFYDGDADLFNELNNFLETL